MLFIGGVSSILYRGGFFCFLDSLFSLDFCCICFLFALCLSCLCQYVTKRGRFRYSCLFFLGGVEIVFVFLFLVSFVLHWLLIYIYEIIHDICLVVYVYVKLRIYFLFTCIFHTCVYAFVECFRNIQVDSVVLLSTLATDR